MDWDGNPLAILILLGHEDLSMIQTPDGNSLSFLGV